MNYDELWETTLNPENRNIIQVLIADTNSANENNENLFNANTKYADERKVFILKGQHKVSYLELDV